MAAGNRAGDPLVSVVIPAFNAEATLGQTIESVLAGSYRNVELIVIDDGSTDATGSIADRCPEADSRVRVRRQENRGLAAALNAGFSAARGDYIARLDADDLWHPRKLERQVALARSEPSLAFIYCWVRHIDSENRVVRDGPAQRFPRRALCRGLYESVVGGGSSALMRRDAVAEVGGVEESFRGWEDLILQLKISAGHPIGHVPEYLVGYRVNPGSMSADPARMFEGWRRIPGWAKSRFPHVPAHVRRWAHGARCALFAEAHAWRGNFRASAALLAEAARADPVWTFRLLVFRTARHLKNRLRGSRPKTTPGPDFFACDPRQQVRPDPYRAEIERGGIGRLQRRRIGQLSRLDAASESHGIAD